MELSSVRALKAEVSADILGPLLREAREARSFGLAAGPMRRAVKPERGVALGIAGGPSPHQYRLAVRIQRRTFEDDGDLRRRLESVSHSEVDIRYVGRVAKRTTADPAVHPAVHGPMPPWFRLRQRPLLIGCSVGHHAVTAGSLGGFFRHRETGRTVLLSNNHVLANEDLAKPGDAVLQPGRFDGGRRFKDRIGTLVGTVPMKTDGSNLMDAAIAGLAEGVPFDPRSITGFGLLRGLRDRPVEPGDEVLKIGRTTGLTHGVVTAIELDDVVVDYDRGQITFDRQIEIEGAGGSPFSSGGDSGSLILDREGDACALLFAGSDHGGSNGKGVTNANDLSLVMETLNLELALEPLIA
ncbi:preprotein translocase subunit YajC [Skermanella pratensis]|uniref:preprotein translocase subunit YajC n=1 Tax=Skermanella pratensis TaxID=2233999 RepID=UPI00130142E6|nr:preprotein translocase subunit YajC [Skermanella pratensis]